MELRLWLVVGFLCLPAFCAAPQDTLRLAGHLAKLREHVVLELPPEEFKALQSEFLTWIDSRVKAGTSIDNMNAELGAAKLLSDGPQTIDDQFDKSYAGYLGHIESRPVPGADGPLVLVVGIHTGGYCDFDDTLLLYQRAPLRRIGWINAEPSYSHGYHLHNFTMEQEGPARGRIVASAWVASNCTSVWNGGRLRIDAAGPQSMTNLLNRGVGFRNSADVAITIHNAQVQFAYTTMVSDGNALEQDAIATYHLQAGRAIRIPPIASTYAGFISEWLTMADAAPVSSPQAAAMHHALAAKRELFHWEHVADCPGPEPSREIAVRWDKSKQPIVFRISGATAAQMRMISVSAQRSPSCHEIPMGDDLHTVTAAPGP